MWTVNGESADFSVNAIIKQSKKRKRINDVHVAPPRPSTKTSQGAGKNGWNKVKIPHQLVDLDNADGDVISLEELQEYTIDPKGNIVLPDDVESHAALQQTSTFMESGTKIDEIKGKIDTNRIPLPRPVTLPLWKNVPLQLLNSLQELDYTKPTAIQSTIIPFIRKGKDVVGIAETGSGKTLAYIIPILERVLNQTDAPLPIALILVPTRELALQIHEHIAAMTKYMFLRTAVIIGGLSADKQRRQMQSASSIWIATPGRLADLIAEDEQILAKLRTVHFLVLDEVDRLLQPGHFEVMESLLRHFRDKHHDFKHESPHFSNATAADFTNTMAQFLLFSATTDAIFTQKDLAINNGAFDSTTISRLLRSRFSINREFEVVDVRQGFQMAQKLVQTKIECIAGEKDLYLTYVLSRYPGRSVVFVNSIDGARRLSSILGLLEFNVLTIHSELQQKQRLQRLERFVASKNAILLASDVAARGLDLPVVDHVIHFQVPRSVELYIHRSGRTARQHHAGLSILICSPGEVAAVNKLIAKLGPTDKINDFPIDLAVLRAVEKRVSLAKSIDSSLHQQQKRKFDKSWIKKMADELEVDHSANEDEDKDADTIQSARSGDSKKIQSDKMQLKALLQKPLRPKGLKTKYISGALADLLLHANNHSMIQGIGQTKAIEDALNVQSN